MRKKILLVDDEPGFGRLLQNVIPDYEIRQALTATAALAVSHLWRPDLFILDLRLPDLDGDELATLICRDPELRHTPMLYISALVRLPDSTDEPVLRHGIPAFSKPFDVATLRRHVARQIIDSESHSLWS